MSDASTSELTKRERQVAELIVTGLSNPEIAKAMGISPKTVDTHRAKVLGKLKLKNNVMLTRFAIRAGWIEA